MNNISESSTRETRIYHTLGMLLVFLVISAIVFVFVKTLVFDRPLNSQALSQSLVAASIGVTVVCLIAWLLDLLNIIDLRPGWGKLLWTVLIASVLGNSAIAYKRFSSGNDSSGVELVCTRVIDSSEPSDPFAIRKSSTYKRGDNVPLFFSVRDPQEDKDGNFNLNIRYSFIDKQSSRASILEQPFSGNANKIKTDPNRIKIKQKYKEIVPECILDNTIQVAQSPRFDYSNFTSGTYTLRIEVFDNVSGQFSGSEIPIRIVD